MDFEDSNLVRLDAAGLAEGLSEAAAKQNRFNSTSLASPLDIVVRERLLESLKPQLRLGASVPCDVLVFGYGDDNGRELTKIGGLPYWPAELPWPTSDDGSPLEFLAQFNFCESSDILPSLPGELLSVFVRQHHFEMCLFHVQWHFLNESASLISEESLPAIEEPLVFSPAFGVPCRVMDYPDAVPLSTVDMTDDWQSVAIIHASKIGGAPSYFSDEPPETTGTFICALHSLRHPVGVPWPFVNVDEPLTPEMLGGVGCNGGRGCHDTVKFADLGALYFFLQTDGSMRILLQSWECQEFLNTRCA